VAQVEPFRAVRYARPSPSVVAPPYDVLSASERDALAASDSHNVVRLTLHEPEEEAGALFRRWLEDGVLVRDGDPAYWILEQDYTGPDGIERTRRGIVASLRADPYDAGSVLPHERTHAGPKEGRLRLLRAAQAQIEPILLLYEGAAPVDAPAREPDIAADGARLWRLDADTAVGEFFRDRQLLIADGHHRYETTLAYGAGTPVLAVLVSTADPGLEIFPTHRVFAGRPDLIERLADGHATELDDPARALDALAAEQYDRAAVVAYARGSTRLAHGEAGELDVELVDRFGHDGISYTADWREAVRRVDEREADVTFLLRPTRIGDVFQRARRGAVMPQKTTYFYPKLLSGLLFLPLEP
jgi:uncharacterized protein (DUF1015 family)